MWPRDTHSDADRHGVGCVAILLELLFGFFVCVFAFSLSLLFLFVLCVLLCWILSLLLFFFLFFFFSLRELLSRGCERCMGHGPRGHAGLSRSAPASPTVQSHGMHVILGMCLEHTPTLRLQRGSSPHGRAVNVSPYRGRGHRVPQRIRRKAAQRRIQMGGGNERASHCKTAL